RDAISQIGPGDARPRAAITFDDAYSGAITAGIAELRSRHLPATVFVTPGFLGGKSFWWDVFADTETGLDPALRERALAEAHGLSAMVGAIAQRSGVGMHDMPAHACGASLGQLHAALEYDKMSLAAHTMNHPNLISLTDAELAQELAQPLEWLRQFGDRALPMVSYPYGLADNRVRTAARTAGYTAGFMIDGGWTTAAPRDPFAIPRLNIPAGVSRNGFILRAAGLLRG
ncbi:MAG TPA: polysaccharide deacetylase family protein, partial [Gemmatimonadaceae bacterium]|nr:polysaccharide deacetylase family protein [Gemmatimonadaceae bacterium]